MPQRLFTIASPHAVYRSDHQLREVQEIEDLLLSMRDVWPSLIGYEGNDTANETFRTSKMSLTELREIEVFFHLFMRDLSHPFKVSIIGEHKLLDDCTKYSKKDFTQELSESLRWDIQPMERAILASLYLDKDQVPVEFKYIYDLTHGTMYHKYDLFFSLDQQLRSIPSKHWKIFLSNSSIKEKMAFLNDSWIKENLEIDTVTVEDLRTNSLTERCFLTSSYYHINKDELMKRVRHLLCKGLFNDTEPTTMEDIGELYDRLLCYKGAIMWETASLQFPDDELVFLWNRSMVSQSLEEAWHLPTILERVNDSIPYFKVTHHKGVKDGNKSLPVVDVEVWTNDQLRDVLGYDWMFDQGPILENNWIVNIKKETDLYKVREVLLEVISSNSSWATMTVREGDINQFGVRTRNSQIIMGEDIDPGIMIKTNNDQLLWLKEFSPEEMLRSSDDDEKKLVEQDSDESRNSIVRTVPMPNFFIDDSILEGEYDQLRNQDDGVVDGDETEVGGTLEPSLSTSCCDLI